MYSACLYCHGNLGRNEMLPNFEIGRRLAFDSKKGRLWVVCRHCARWNLSPLEQRWEAIEECERQFRRTRIRVSTANIGLVELRSGFTLIRIGNNFLFSGEWWIVVFPGTALATLILAVNLLGDWLRDALNPKLR